MHILGLEYGIIRYKDNNTIQLVSNSLCFLHHLSTKISAEDIRSSSSAPGSAGLRLFVTWNLTGYYFLPAGARNKQFSSCTELRLALHQRKVCRDIIFVMCCGSFDSGQMG